ncbi:MAG: PAS domain S-box protein [Nitrospirota bacterium]|jgi:PAS domain S-box-containing protein
MMDDFAASRGDLLQELRTLRERVAELEGRDLDAGQPVAGDGERSQAPLHATVETLEASEARYRALFEDSPISLWEEDFSEVKRLLDVVREGGITDLRGHLDDHPEEIARCASAVRILDVNRATLPLLEAESKDALLAGLPRYFTEDSLAVFKEELIALAAGRTSFESEGALRTRTGRILHVIVTLSIAPGHEESWSRVVVSLLDVTVRRHVEGALRESRREWQTLVSNLPGFVYRCRHDRDWTMEMISDGCERLTGYPAADLLHSRCLSFDDLIHPDDRQSVWEAVQEAVARRDSFRLQYRITARDGTEKWVWEQGRAIFVATSDAVALEGYITDISPVRHAQEMAIQFGHLIEDSLNEVYIFDARTLRFLRVNRGARQNLGYSTEEMLLLTPLDLKPELTAETFAALTEPLRSGERDKIQITTVHRRKDGSLYPVEVHLQLSHFGAAPAFVANITDITERSRAEEKLRKLSAAVEQSPVSVIITDARGDIEYANPKFTEVTGYRLAEVLGQNPRVLKSGEMSREGYRQLWETIAAGRHWHGEFHNKKKNGELFWEQASISPIRDDAGAITHFVAVKEDITARKEMEAETRALEAQLRQAQKMETIGTLAGGIAHDFNNLLQAIIGYGGMVLEDTPEDSRPNAYVQHILKAAESAKDLVRQILTFSRQVNVERRPVRIDRVVNEAMVLVRATIPPSIVLQQSIDPHVNSVVAEVSEIHQLVMNLCTNASHAMRDRGGMLDVRLETVTITRELSATRRRLVPGEYVRLRVSDTGTGIDPSHLERIFDPFFTTKGPQEGTGLGLSVVHGIVTAQGGEIVVDTALGQGTTFDIYLPPAEPAEDGGDSAAPRDATGDERILLVEDDAEVAGLVQEMLERLGYRVIRCANGAEALETVLSAPQDFDLVVTDHMMPDLTGIRLAEELRGVLPGLPIVLVTGFGEAISGEEMQDVGIREIVRKPVLGVELSRAIRRVMDGPVGHSQ